MFEITSGKVAKAQKVIIYGPEGIGKTTFASKFPNPLFIDTEGSTSNMDVKRLPNPSSWTMLLEEIEYIKNNSKICSTLVIDTADWAEQLAMISVCANKNVKGIEDIGYGKGYVYLYEEFGKLLNKLNELIDKGINVVFTAHAQMRKFEQPDEMGAYDRWELKLQKKTAPLIKEWADIVLFSNYKTLVVNVDGQGANKGKNKAQGGQRVMYASHHPCWDAKNRHGLPEEMPMSYEQIKHIFENSTIVTEDIQTKTVKTEVKPTVTMDEADNPTEKQSDSLPLIVEDDYGGLPKALIDLMKPNQVTKYEIQYVVSKKGYYTIDTPIEKYDPNFIQGVLIGAWEQVFEMIKKDRELPF